jgi:hypothetical protein
MQPDKHTSTGTTSSDEFSAAFPLTPSIIRRALNFADVHPFVHF